MFLSATKWKRYAFMKYKLTSLSFLTLPDEIINYVSWIVSRVIRVCHLEQKSLNKSVQYVAMYLPKYDKNVFF